MRKLAENGLEWLEFDLLAEIPGLKHGVYLRSGGFSEGAFKSLNLSYDVGDNASFVNQNVAKLHSHFQDNNQQKALKWGHQCHGKQVAYIDERSSAEIGFCDSLMTATPNLTLLIKHADCQAAIFYDPKNHAIANVHAGWRGNVINIYAETIAAMQRQFGSKPSDLLVCISPSLGPEEAEFINYKSEFPEEMWSFQVRPHFFDLWAYSEYQLQQAGILPHHIEIARICTKSNPHDYFSYRRDKVTGRNATCVGLKAFHHG
jgi:hypothetical protein